MAKVRLSESSNRISPARTFYCHLRPYMSFHNEEDLVPGFEAVTQFAYSVVTDQVVELDKSS